ncbi:hypothetical protein DSM104299_04042 [Baekduia alba]|nr:hypothetical protein DSM104299_04042 [Baekduia alba]
MVRSWTVAGVVAASVVLGACGSSSDSSSDSAGASTTATAAAGPKGTPIKVGLLVDASGPQNGGQGGAADVLEAWAKATNAAGGIAKHPVAIEVKDTAGSPSKAATAAQGLVADKSVAAVVLNDAAADAPAAKPLSAAGLPVIGGNGFNPAVWGAAPGNKLAKIPQLPNVYGVTAAFPANAAPFVTVAKQAGYKTIAALDEAQNPSSKQATQLIAGMGKAEGLDFVAGITIDATAPNFTAQCLQLVQKKVQYAALTMPDATAKRLAADCARQGYKGAFGAGAALVTPLFYKSLSGNKLMGGLTGFPWYADTPPVKNYRQVMDDNKVSEDKWARGDSTAAWATMELFKKALDANAATLSPTVNRADVVAAYGTIKGETLDGLLPGPVTYTKGKPAPAPSCAWLYGYQDGKFTGTAEPTCPDPRLGVG